MIPVKYLLVIIFLLSKGGILFSQKSKIYDSQFDIYNTALQLFQKERYALSQNKFQELLSKNSPDKKEIQANIKYYIALCALKLKNNNCEYLMSYFIKEYPYNKNVQYAHFYLGGYYYATGVFSKAIEQFSLVNEKNLKKEEQQEYYFKLGYSYLEEKEYDKSKLLFANNIKEDNIYKLAGTYYYSYLLYAENNYNSALKGFKKLTEYEQFKPMVLYYTSQIYFKKGDYDKALEHTLPLQENKQSKRIKEIYIIIGNSYFGKKEYDKAIEYLSEYKLATEDREAIYHLAYSYYRKKEYKKAEVYFEKVISQRDNISQNAYYHLADCYLKSGEKIKAKLAFENAYILNFNPSIEEDALFNYAKLTYETSTGAFSGAIGAFNQYIEKYKNTERADVSYDYLVKIFMTTNNYIGALDMIEKIENKTPIIQTAYQKVSYYRALELYNDLKFNEALKYFDQSLQYSLYNKKIKALSLYWKGEAHYRLKEYQQCIESEEKVLLLSMAYYLPIYNNVYYNLGYAYFRLNEYKKSKESFRKYSNVTKNQSTEKRADAYNRIGDCYLIHQDFTNASIYYKRAFEIGLSSPDYALFQEALTEGLNKNYDTKIQILNKFISNYPESDLLIDAYFELAKANMSRSNNREAITIFDKIVANYPNTQLGRKALLQTGLVYFNMRDNKKAVERYKEVVKKYPETSEANSAIHGMKNAYIEGDNLNDYFAYTQGVSKEMKISGTEKDSLIFIAAEKKYLTGKYDDALIYLRSYLEEFPNGIFISNVHFFLAECLRRKNDWDNALESYTYVINNSKDLFIEEALKNASDINYTKKNYDLALEQYQKLETTAEITENKRKAKIGLMKCYFQMKDYPNTIEKANDLMNMTKIDEEIKREAIYSIASSYYNLSNYTDAVRNFRRIGGNTKSIRGAESKYRIADIMIRWGHYDKAEKEILELVKSGTSHQYWLGKSFILLSNIQIHNKDFFQAKQTLQSVLNNYTNIDDQLLNEINNKLKYIDNLELNY